MSAAAEVAEKDAAASYAATPEHVAEDVLSCEATCHLKSTDHLRVLNPDMQKRWAACSVRERLRVLRRARHSMAARSEEITQAISSNLNRSASDTLVAELLPLLEAIRFLERRAGKILASRKLSAGRPVWLMGVQAEVERVPMGHVLVIGPSNFPLFLPGAQVVQALAAGNAVTWKPGLGGERVASLVQDILFESGLPKGLLCVTGESVAAAEEALATHPDKVIFTGSFPTGRTLLHTLAETATPAVLELSGADAVVVLPSANLSAAAKAIAFGLRLNGGEVCMSPRRLFATYETMLVLRPLLGAELATVPPVRLRPAVQRSLRLLIDAATAEGARLEGDWTPEAQRPLLLDGARSDMEIARSDVFAPVLSLIEAPSVLHIANLVNSCPYALTAAVFGSEREARALGQELRVGTVLVNDLIAPTADPRVPFGGAGHSGFGATRGEDGLLEMTRARSILVRRRPSTQHYKPVADREVRLFTGFIGLLHGGSLRNRVRSLRGLLGTRSEP